jgi:hypothetical protein
MFGWLNLKYSAAVRNSSSMYVSNGISHAMGHGIEFTGRHWHDAAFAR